MMILKMYTGGDPSVKCVIYINIDIYLKGRQLEVNSLCCPVVCLVGFFHHPS